MSTDGPLILVVDDEPTLCWMVSRHLQRAGHHTMTANDAPTARAILGEHDVALVLLDVTMPGEDGMSLLRHIVTDFTDIAVVMVTGVDDADLAQATLEQGAFGYVIKPFEVNELIINVANALRRRELEIENRQHRTQLESLVVARTTDLEDAVRRLVAAEAALRASHEDTIRRLALAAEYHEPNTGAHLVRMSRYAELLAKLAGLEPERIDAVRVASPLHDVGKIAIPGAILNKPGPLDEEEWAVMRQHPRLGADLLSQSDSDLLRLGGVISLAHHERWDGTGYPNKLAGEAIPIEGRIVAIADVFDALTTVRPYKPAFPVDEAVSIMRESRGTHFDPHLLDAFLENLLSVLEIRDTATTEPNSFVAA